MSSAASKVVNWSPSPSTGTGSPRVGRIIDVSEDGRARVRLNGPDRLPVVARTAVAISAREAVGLPVLVVFEDGDARRPIIVGVVRETLGDAQEREHEGDAVTGQPAQRPDVTADEPDGAWAEAKLAKDEHRDVRVDGRRLLLDAYQEVVLRCGKSSIVLRKDGKIVVRGVEIVSQAARVNKIRGGAVQIN